MESKKEVMHKSESWRCHGGVVLIPNGWLDVRNCPDPEMLARRIVACVNACAGSSTEWLRGCGDMLNAADCAKPLQQNIRELAAQRDELLAVLKLAEPLVEQTVDVSGYKTHANRRVLVAVRAAIAKCEVKS